MAATATRDNAAGGAGEFDRSLGRFIRNALRVSRAHPRTALHFLHMTRVHRHAATRRLEWEDQGVHVPPFMIMSITRRCNFRCKGCFVQVHNSPVGEELAYWELRRVIHEAHELGVSIIALAGGEPLTRPRILDITRDYREIIFPLITNGSLLTDDLLDQLQVQRNVIPVISVEGHRGETDERRGEGVHARAVEVMERMRRRGMFFGASIMVTRANYDLVMGRDFARSLSNRGVKFFFYVDYVPIEPGTEDLVPTQAQRNYEPVAMSLLQREFRGIFVASSASEEAFGGCMAAGRGFVHVSANGDLEPCPFSPFSDVSLRDKSLRDALRSGFLRRIRESEEHLTESQGGCALWAKRDWVSSLLPPSSLLSPTVGPPNPGEGQLCLSLRPNSC